MKAIVAAAKNWTIGKEGKIPWYCPEDLSFFKTSTMDQNIVVGRKTFETLPVLTGRRVYVLTRKTNLSETFFTNLTKWQNKGCHPVLIGSLSEIPKDAIVCGGAELYKTLMPKIDEFLITEIDGEHEGDAFFPVAEFKRRFTKRGELIKEGEGYKIYRYDKTPSII